MKYATALFAPVVVVVVVLAVWREHGGGAGLAAGLAALCSWVMAVAVAVGVGGRDYWRGITTSTLARPESSVPVATVLQRAYVWTGLILLLGVLGAVLASRSAERGKLLPAALIAAALVAPAVQAWLHTTVSLQKHVVFGAWFAAIAAGYAMARLSRVDPGRGWAAVMALPIAASTLFGSMGQAAAMYKVWPDSAAAVQVLQSAVRSHPGHYLAEDYDVEAYYLRSEVPWPQWSSTYRFSYPGTPAGAPSYAAAFERHYFSLVILDFGDTAATDTRITADMRRAGGYHVVARAGRFTIWAARRPAPARSPGGTVAVAEPYAAEQRQGLYLPRPPDLPGEVRLLWPAAPLGVRVSARRVRRGPVRVHPRGRARLGGLTAHVAAADGHSAAGRGQLLAAHRAPEADPDRAPGCRGQLPGAGRERGCVPAQRRRARWPC